MKKLNCFCFLVIRPITLPAQDHPLVVEEEKQVNNRFEKETFV